MWDGRAATNPTPHLALPLIPAAAAPGDEAFTLTVNGTGFVLGAVVNWNGGARATTFLSNSQLKAAITKDDVALAGTATVTVTNPGPGGGTSNPEYFAVSKPTPTLAFQDSVLPKVANATEVVVGDFNGDGKPDLAVLESVLDVQFNTHPVLKILIGNGDGTFQEPLEASSAPVGIFVKGLAVGDFNGDGRLDLVDTDFIGQEHLVSQIDPGDFRTEVDPATQRIGRGGETTFNISVSPINEFKGTVSFIVSGLPGGATAVFNPSTVSIPGTTELMITATGETPMGSHPLVWTATSGSLSHSGTITLNVGPKNDFTDFSISIEESFQTITPGANGSFHISTTQLNGFGTNVALSVSGLPGGATASFSPGEIDGGSGTSVLAVTTLSGTPTGTYPLTITGTSEEGKQSRAHSMAVNLNVGPAGTDFRDFTLTVTPLAQTIAAGSGAIFTITTTAINGPSDILLDTDSDAPVTVQSIYPSVIFGGSGSVLLGVLTSPLTPPGTYTVRVFGSGSVRHGAQATITVTP